MQTDTAFRQKIYAIVAKIPRGKVASYGLIALLARRPNAARAVGRAMQEVPFGHTLPCHRVLRSDGSLAPPHVFGTRQRKLLEREGVLFLPSGRVDMRRSEWDG